MPETTTTISHLAMFRKSRAGASVRNANKSPRGWHGGLVVGRRTCDLGVAGSRPSRDAAAQQP